MLEKIRNDVREALIELLDLSNLKKNDIFVLGGSTSEVLGYHIGKHSSEEVGEVIIDEIYNILNKRGIFLAVQGCEHINRALTVPREILNFYDLEEVSVVPSLHAGGSLSMNYYKILEDPILVEHIVAKAGMDIGDTSIGMHVKFVQVPVRLKVKKINEANLTALRSRPKLIGGVRAKYKNAVEANRD